MPKSWSNKDERMYEHIKESASDSGRSAKRAKQIAAATVNKKRSAEGRTKTSRSKSSSGSSSRTSARSRTGSRTGGRKGGRSRTTSRARASSRGG